MQQTVKFELEPRFEYWQGAYGTPIINDAFVETQEYVGFASI
jgi:hypothetical protein